MKKFLLASALAGLSTLAQAAPETFTAILNGGNEAPPNASLGTGTATVIIDAAAHTMSVQVSFSGLTGNVTACHIHGPTAAPVTGTAGVMTPTPTFPGFPSGVTSGSYNQIFDMTLASSYGSAFLTSNGGSAGAAENTLFKAIRDGKAYLNIHSSFLPGGEIRGFLVPEPATGTLIAAGLLSVLAFRRKEERE